MTNPKERCAACGMPRDAHWGAHPICAGRCTGFESSAKERVRAAAPDLLAALQDARTALLMAAQDLIRAGEPQKAADIKTAADMTLAAIAKAEA